MTREPRPVGTIGEAMAVLAATPTPTEAAAGRAGRARP
jgi:hypothetical protein